MEGGFLGLNPAYAWEPRSLSFLIYEMGMNPVLSSQGGWGDKWPGLAHGRGFLERDLPGSYLWPAGLGASFALLTLDISVLWSGQWLCPPKAFRHRPTGGSHTGVTAGTWSSTSRLQSPLEPPGARLALGPMFRTPPGHLSLLRVHSPPSQRAPTPRDPPASWSLASQDRQNPWGSPRLGRVRGRPGW